MTQSTRNNTVPPVPQNAVGPKVPPCGYLVQEVDDGVYWVTDGGYQCAFVVCDDEVIAIDAPPSLGGLVTRAIRDVTSKTITHVVYTHFHGDHIGRVDQFPDDATRIAQQETHTMLRETRDPLRRLPDVTFKDSYRMEVGGQVLEMHYKGNNHAPGNSFVYLPRQKILMLVDVIYPGWVPFTNIAQSKHIPGFMAHHDHTLAFDFDTMITGHLTRLGTRQDVEMQREYMHDIRDAAQHALELTPVKRARARDTVGTEHIYEYFKTMYEGAAAEAAKPVIDKWSGRLGGVETLGVNHTLTMYHSLRLDGNVEPHVVFFPPADSSACHDHEC
ncbi:MBL fold metallo-hydrolase [Actinacidiphila glaucinigra]|uniref:Glyoxylase, beta-lactamase superfamily II n=1 Tax=Actinacidiphila glaucinigra TaxID=235986 RepID=A0A239MVD1_9ACTN|nr:MBL fold metallo-hydrolase [Actinacidiphila glaucinigra]SNT45829.1 Glyoxylase, beta-lactamase superfamily II [Actinacidiphila glaucinigra]